MPTSARLTPRRRTATAAGAAVLLIAALSGCGVIQSLVPDRETRDESGTITEGGTTEVFELAVGDCLNDAALASAEGDESVEVLQIPTVPCDEPHDFEVYLNLTVPDADEYPGEDAVVATAEEQCLPAFETFVGVSFEESLLNASYYYPTTESWVDGDRTINCLILDDAGKTTGSLAGAAR